MTERKRKITIAILWVIVVLSLPVAIPYVATMLFYYYFSGYGGSERETLYLILALMPVAGLIAIGYWLRNLMSQPRDRESRQPSSSRQASNRR